MVKSHERVGWFTAYQRFLTDSRESTALKVAPLVLGGLLPPELATNLLPVIGEVDDVGFAATAAAVALMTIKHVSAHRYPPQPTSR